MRDHISGIPYKDVDDVGVNAINAGVVIINFVVLDIASLQVIFPPVHEIGHFFVLRGTAA